jgi:hypothetical protein
MAEAVIELSERLSASGVDLADQPDVVRSGRLHDL